MFFTSEKKPLINLQTGIVVKPTTLDVLVSILSKSIGDKQAVSALYDRGDPGVLLEKVTSLTGLSTRPTEVGGFRQCVV